MTDWQKRAEELEAELRAVRAQRDDARGALSQRIALRRDIEEILGVESGPASDEQLARGVEAVKALRARAEDAERKLAAMTERYRIAIDMGERILAVGDGADREVAADTMRRAAFICDTMTFGGSVSPRVADALREEADRIEAEALASPARVAGRVEE